MIALLAVVGTGRAAGGAGRTALIVLGAAAWPLALAAVAPGAAVAPLAIAALAIASGLAARRADGTACQSIPWALAAAGSLVAIWGLVQALGGLEASARALEGGPGIGPETATAIARLREGRAFAGFAPPAAMGGFLALALPVTIGEALARAGRLRLVLLACAAIEVCGLAATGSATAVGSLFVALVLWTISRGRRRRPGPRISRALMAGVAGVVVLLLAGIVAVRRDRLADLASPQSSWTLRAGNVKAALSMTTDHPWKGVGPGCFGEVYPGYRPAGGNEVRHAHDLPVELAAELGIPLGLLSAFVFYGVFLGPLLQRRGPAPAWKEGAAIGMAAFAVQNLADFTAWFPSILWTACVLRGVWDPPLGETEPRDAHDRLLTACALAVTIAAVIACAGAGLSWNARWEASQESAAEHPEQALALTARAVRLAPWDPDAQLQRATLMREQSNGREDVLRAALVEADRAVALSPVRPSARRIRAQVRVLLGDIPGAYADALEAARLYPSDAEYRLRAEAAAARLSRAYPRGEPR